MRAKWLRCWIVLALMCTMHSATLCQPPQHAHVSLLLHNSSRAPAYTLSHVYHAIPTCAHIVVQLQGVRSTTASQTWRSARSLASGMTSWVMQGYEMVHAHSLVCARVRVYACVYERERGGREVCVRERTRMLPCQPLAALSAGTC